MEEGDLCGISTRDVASLISSLCLLVSVSGLVAVFERHASQILNLGGGLLFYGTHGKAMIRLWYGYGMAMAWLWLWHGYGLKTWMKEYSDRLVYPIDTTTKKGQQDMMALRLKSG